MTHWKVKILTLIPDLFPGPLSHSVVGNALKSGIWQLQVYNIRDFALDKHRTVDDSSYGGGTGLVIKPDVLGNAIESCFDVDKPIIAMSPRGNKFDQYMAQNFAAQDVLQIIAGRFEAIDQRILDFFNIQEVSIGDYVISGGDIAAYTIIDATVRLLPKVLSNHGNGPLEESLSTQGKYENLLEYPQYTKPRIWRNLQVPEELTSGNHSVIAQWRYNNAKKLTKLQRRDLWLRNIETLQLDE